MIEFLDWEKLENNGVGQSFALALSLFSSAPADSTSGGTSAAGTVASPGGSAGSLAVSGSGSDLGGSMGPLPATLLVTSSTALIGQPTFASQGFGAVGPTVDGGSIAVASNGNSLESGIRYGSALNWNDWLADEPQVAGLDRPGELPLPDNAVQTAAAAVDLIGPASMADSIGADEALRRRNCFCNWAPACKIGWAWQPGRANLAPATPKHTMRIPKRRKCPTRDRSLVISNIDPGARPRWCVPIWRRPPARSSSVWRPGG